jgi:PAS domain S-box-containing protein
MVAATLLRWSLTPLLADGFPYLLQFLTLLVCARYLGFAPGIVATIIGFGASIFRVLYFGPASAVNGRFWLTACFGVALCVFATWVISRQARMQRELERNALLAAARLEQLTAEAIERERHLALGAQLRTIVESSEDAIVSKDLNGVIQSWNRGAEQIFGYTQSEAVGQSISMLVPADRKSEETGVLESIRRGEPVKHFETVRLHKSGKEIHVSLIVAPIRDARGEVTGASHIARDVSARKLMEEQVRQTQKLESLGVLAGGLAHDFNNLLTGVIGNASLALEDVDSNSPVFDRLNEVLGASERAARLVRQMLAYAGEGRFVIQPVDLSQLIADLTPLVRASVPSPRTLELHLAPKLPLVEADAAQMQQLVMNLAVNAAEAIEEGPGRVTIATGVRMTGGHQQVVLEVSDTGCGMEEEVRQRIFDPFYSTKFTGRGLGLAAALGIIRGHSGSISVTSAPGRGSAFTVLLPASKLYQATAVPRSGHESGGSGTVLVVDDEEMVRNLARSALERSGYEVETACDGLSAVECFAARPHAFDAVLLDLTMPVMSGHEAMDRILSIRAGIPVILSSGYSEAEALRGFTGLGPADFLQKPYTPSGLTHKVRQVLGRKTTNALDRADS